MLSHVPSAGLGTHITEGRATTTIHPAEIQATRRDRAHHFAGPEGVEVHPALIQKTPRERRGRVSGAPALKAHPAATPKARRGHVKASTKHSSAVATPSVPGYTPAEIRQAYGLPSLTGLSATWSGAGETIAIVVAYNDPYIQADLAEFDTEFKLSAPPSFQVFNQSGAQSPLPSSAPLSSGQSLSAWVEETALDVEWAHAIAPGANIDLVEASSTNLSDLTTAVASAANLPGVSVVSMSWDSLESPDESVFDSTFTTPAGHQGVTFVAAAGDSGSFATYPASSPNVLAVGGTTLSLSLGNSSTNAATYEGETSWSLGGGGVSQYEPVPSYQAGLAGNDGHRMTPDVSFDASPSSGVAIYDATGQGQGGWSDVGGTSLGAPAWAAIVAIADGMRASTGHASLDGASQTLPALYSLPSSDFHQIGNSYNTSTGLGSPVANELIPGLADYGTGITPQTTQTTPVTKTTLKKIHIATKAIVRHVVKFAAHSKAGHVAKTAFSDSHA